MGVGAEMEAGAGVEAEAGAGAGVGARVGAGAEAGARAGAKSGAGMEAEVEARAGAETGAQASRTALKILCKSSLEYLRILVAATEASVTGVFVLEGLTGWSDNLSPDM